MSLVYRHKIRGKKGVTATAFRSNWPIKGSAYEGAILVPFLPLICLRCCPLKVKVLFDRIMLIRLQILIVLRTLIKVLID